MKRNILLLIVLGIIAAFTMSACSFVGGAVSDTGRMIQKTGDKVKSF